MASALISDFGRGGGGAELESEAADPVLELVIGLEAHPECGERGGAMGSTVCSCVRLAYTNARLTPCDL